MDVLGRQHTAPSEAPAEAAGAIARLEEVLQRVQQGDISSSPQLNEALSSIPFMDVRGIRAVNCTHEPTRRALYALLRDMNAIITQKEVALEGDPATASRVADVIGS